MRELFPAVRVEDKLHVVRSQNVLTSAGISAASRWPCGWWRAYHGEAIAQNTARFMEYRYTTDNSRRV